MNRWCGWRSVVVVAAVLLVFGCGDNLKQPDAGVAGDAGRTQVERGRYIMNTLGACTFCHTPLNPDGTRNNTRLFAGWSCNDPIPFLDAAPGVPNVGCLNARNLTNHATGLANATDAQIKAAIRDGHRTDGKTLVPIMPYWVFHNMTDGDVDAIVAYLRTVPGVDNTIPPNEPPWNDINDNNANAPICTGGVNGCFAVPLDPDAIPLPLGPNTVRAMRGRYLSSMVGLCVDCHTPDFPIPPGGMFPPFFPTPVNSAKIWGGGRVFPKEQLGLVDPSYPAFITTRNVTPDATGLMGWTNVQVQDAIARGKDRDGKAVCAATHGSLISPYAALDPEDLEDIAIYLQLLPPVANDTGANCAGPAVP